MEKSGYLKEIRKEKDGWRCAFIRDGGQCHVVGGRFLIFMWPAINLDIPEEVCDNVYDVNYNHWSCKQGVKCLNLLRVCFSFFPYIYFLIIYIYIYIYIYTFF